MSLLSNPLFYSFLTCRKVQVLSRISGKVPVELLFHTAYEPTSHIYQEIMGKGKYGWSYPWKIQIESQELGVKLVDRVFENYKKARPYIIDYLKNDSEIYIWTSKWMPSPNTIAEGMHSLTLTSFDGRQFKVFDTRFEMLYAEDIIENGFDHLPIQYKNVTRVTIQNGILHQNAIHPIKEHFKEKMLAIKDDFSFYDNIASNYNELGNDIWLRRSAQAFGVISLSRLLISIYMKHTSYSDRTIDQMLQISKATETIKNYLIKGSMAPHKFDIADFQERCAKIRGLEEKSLIELQNELLTGIKKNRVQTKLKPPSGCMIYATDTSLWLEWEDKQSEFEQIDYEIWLNHTLVCATSASQCTLGNLEPSKNYCLTIRAKNQFGQFSEGLHVEASTSNIVNDGNLALYKPVMASSIENTVFACNHVVDNDPYTRWSSEFQDNQWIYVDLGLRKRISKIRLNWENAHPNKYRIELSDNLDNWDLIHDEVSGRPGVLELDHLDQIGRFVRVTCISRATVYGISLYEFSVLHEVEKG